MCKYRTVVKAYIAKVAISKVQIVELISSNAQIIYVLFRKIKYYLITTKKDIISLKQFRCLQLDGKIGEQIRASEKTGVLNFYSINI